jgi:hypothetical protein
LAGGAEEGGITDAGEVMRRILAAYEAGDLISTCAWCERIELDGKWVMAPHAAMSAIDSRFTLSHSICPRCAAADRPESSASRGAPR